MNHTFASQVKQQLESIGYEFTKCSDNYWNFTENSCTIKSNRSLGVLLKELAKDFGIN